MHAADDRGNALDVTGNDDLPPSSLLSAYLRTSGWRFIAEDELWTQFSRTFDSQEVVLRVPLLHNAVDYQRRVRELLTNLGKLEQRSVDLVVRDVRWLGRRRRRRSTPKKLAPPGRSRIRGNMEASERLSWPQLRERYPDQWIVLVDHDWHADDLSRYDTARVLACGASRAEAIAHAGSALDEYGGYGCRYTGTIRSPLFELKQLLLDR